LEELFLALESFPDPENASGMEKDISFLWNTVVNMRFYENEKLHPHLLFSISATEACARSMRDD
jgi:hypothetical protein